MNAFMTLFVLLIFLLSLLVYKKQRLRFQYWKTRGIPFEEPAVIFGNLALLFFRLKTMPQLLQEWYIKYAHLRYFGIYVFNQPTLMVRDMDLIKQICIKEFDKFSDHSEFTPKDGDPFWNNGLFARNGSKWNDMRTILSPAFTGSKLRGMFGLIVECAEEFLDYLKKDKSDIIELDMRDALTKFTNDAIASCAFGYKCNSFEQPHNEFYVTGKAAFDFSGLKGFKFFGSAISEKLMKILNVTMFSENVENFFRRIVKDTIQHRVKFNLKRPDMIHLLRQAQICRLNEDCENTKLANNGSRKEIITDEDITCQAAIFFFGGYDTVGSLLCNTVYALATNPDVQNKLIEEIDNALAECDGKVTYETVKNMQYLDMVVSETLRLWPPAIFLDRKCVKPYTIQPVLPGEKPLHVEVGKRIMFPAYAIHQDPKYFSNPKKFDPERFSDENKNTSEPMAFMPFGMGPRFCIGNRFALLEAKTAILFLLTSFTLVPTNKTTVPYIIDKNSLNIRHAGGYRLGLKRRFQK